MENIIKLRRQVTCLLYNWSKVGFAFLLLLTFALETNASVNPLAQQSQVSGKVIDDSGAPLPGVAILKVGTTVGTQTNIDGEYNIEANNGDVIEFSFIGMISQKFTVGEDKTINVTLREDTKEIDEVVVVGYGVKKKINLSGSVAAVENEYFESRPIVNVGQALQGAVGNLNITQSAGPNAVAEFNVRGMTSLSGGEPLIVIDGITATQTDLGRINPNDIASVSVLKDAASAAIYGARASFGVILVTTKTANSNELQVNVNANTSWRKIGREMDIITDPYEVANFLDIMAVPWYDLFSDEDLEYAKQVSAGQADPTRLNPNNPSRYQYFHSTNWKKIVLKDYTRTHNGNFNISQKFDRGSFYLGAEALRNEGLYNFNTDIHERYNLRLKGSYKLAKWFTLNNNTWIYNNKYDESYATGSGFFRDAVSRWSTQPMYNPDGTPTYYYARMIGALEAGNYTTEEHTYQTKFAAVMNFFDDRLIINADASYKRLLQNRDWYNTPVKYWDGPDHSQIYGPTSPWAKFQNWIESSNNYNVYATYTDEFFEKHAVTLLAGYNQEEFLYNTTNGSRADLISPGLPTVELATGDQTVGQEKYAWAVQGIFGRFNYIFDDKYIFEANVRYDGSSRFPKDDRWVLNPSASLSWVASKESFMEDLFFDVLKFRASYGSLGNQNVGPYPYIANLGTGDTSALLGGKKVTEASSPGLVSPTLTWETVETQNVGIDFAVFNSRLNSSFDYYHRYTKGMLTAGKELPVVLGTDVPTENAADLVTKGWEFSISWKDRINVMKKPLNYSVRFNLSDSRAFIEKFDNPTGSLGQYYVGREIGEMWGFETDGYYQTQEEIDFGPDITAVASYPSTRPTLPGDVKFKDLNNDGKIDFGDNTLDNPGDRKIIGNSRNRFNFGLDINADWNGFDLRAFFQGVGKKNYYPGDWRSRYYFWNAFAFPWSVVTKENYYNHWTPTNRDAFYPRMKSYVAEGGKEVSLTQTRWLQDASYIRLKNLTLGYTIPSSLSDKVGINKLRVYVSGENIFELTKLFKYLDPENLIGDGYPFQRTYSVGVSLNF